MADPATPAAASAVVAIPLASAFLGLEAGLLFWGLAGAVMAQIFMPQPGDQKVWRFFGIAIASMLLAAVLGPFTAPWLQDQASSYKWLSGVGVERYQYLSAVILGAGAQPIFLGIVSVVKKRAPLPKEQ